MQTITPQSCLKMKQDGEKIAMLTAYDATFARQLSNSGVDCMLVGDTMGNVIQGHETTIPVQLADIAYHTSCVARGNSRSLLIADLPFMTYYQVDLALAHATELMQAGAHMVKLEGGDDWIWPIIEGLVRCGIPVCAHIGLTPQSVYQLGGHKVQGRDQDQATSMQHAAKALEEAGASLLVLECVPGQLAQTISENLIIPTIGIGAGPHCDGQVLVTYDMLGMTGKTFKFTKNFLEGQASVEEAIRAYVQAVKNHTFPTQEHSFS